MEMNEGSYVEVSCIEDGLLGSYYVARLVSKLPQNKFVVEYKTLVNKERNGIPLREAVDASMVRPLPPEIRVTMFDLLDKVDAYDHDGWWVGRVSGVYGSEYCVYFDCSLDEFVYPIGKLRVHQEFRNGEWVSSHTKVG